MPNAVTHAYFADDVYKKLPAKVKQKIDLPTMRVFSQGPDIFHHDCFHKDSSQFAQLVHRKHAKKFFQNYIGGMKRYHLERKKEAISSFYGFLLHYILDTTTHPFIFYKTGCYHKEKKETHQYRSLHQEMELLIDLYYMEIKEKKDPKKMRHDRFIFPKTKFSPSMQTLLDDAFQRTYHKEGMGKRYLNSIKYMKLSYRFLRYDPYGIKLKFYLLCDRWKPKTMKKIRYLSYANNLRNKASYFNYEHHKWCYPMDASIEKTESFFELYEISISTALKWILIFHDVFVGKKDLKEAMKNFPSKSYITGISDQVTGAMKYFEDNTNLLKK